MENIVGIIDMNGFRIGKKFYCKELGMIETGKSEGTSYLFDLGIEWVNLTRKQQESCKFLTRHIHKLPFYTPSGSTLHLNNLEPIIEKFYYDVKEDKHSLIAYKGGNIERDLLTKLKIPSINLEDFGCPKADQLFKNLIWLETYGYHIGKDPYLHCPKVEVEAFLDWMIERT